MKKKILLILLLPLFIFSQQFADKSYYLIDSLVLKDLSKTDKNLIDSCLKVYHKSKVDSIKIKAINSITEQCYNENVWPRYNLWVLQFCKKKLKTKCNILFFKKGYSSSLNNMGMFYGSQNKAQKALEYFNQALKISEETGDNVGVTTLLNNMGFIYCNEGSIEKALEYHQKAEVLCKEIGNKDGLALSLNNIGYIYRDQGNIEKALEYYHQSLKISEEIQNKEGIASLLSNIGNIYKSQGNIEKALDCYQQSLIIDEKLGNKIGVSSSLSNIGLIYKGENKTKQALNFYNKALKIDKEIENKEGIALSFNNIGSIYRDQGETEKALEHYHLALKTNKEISNKEGVAISLNNIGICTYESFGSIQKAKEYLSKGLRLSIELGYPKLISKSAKHLSKIAKKQNNYQEAYEMYALHVKMQDSTNNINTQKSTIEQEIKHNYENQKVIDELKIQKQLELEAEKTRRQFLITFSVVSVLTLVLIFLIIIYRRLNISKKQKLIIEQQKKEVEIKRIELEQANKEISDSINYATLIQKAVLPSLKISELQNDAFIYFNPKDRISGDFFWLEQKEQYSGYCVADCTGHGIPGAFISMVGTILLNEIHNSKQLNVPNKILSELSRLIELTLTDRNGNKMKDGMDMSFVLLNNEHKTLYFSGANNPVWIASSSPKKRIDKNIVEPIFEHQGKYMYEIKGDKQPIGFYGDSSKPFSLHNAELIEGDTFYLFSDGYVDQFGGERNKKFKAKAFRELLLSINLEDMDSQKNILSERFESWKGEYEQIDDVTVMGVRV